MSNDHDSHYRYGNVRPPRIVTSANDISQSAIAAATALRQKRNPLAAYFAQEVVQHLREQIPHESWHHIRTAITEPRPGMFQFDGYFLVAGGAIRHATTTQPSMEQLIADVNARLLKPLGRARVDYTEGRSAVETLVRTDTRIDSACSEAAAMVKLSLLGALAADRSRDVTLESADKVTVMATVAPQEMDDRGNIPASADIRYYGLDQAHANLIEQRFAGMNGAEKLSNGSAHYAFQAPTIEAMLVLLKRHIIDPSGHAERAYGLRTTGNGNGRSQA